MKTITAVILLAFAATAQDRMAEALRKGVIEEETRQDLNAAIKSYESVLAQFGKVRKPNADQRKTSAAALFRMAESYRKLGRSAEAATAYRRLLSEFGDQAALAAQSRVRLAGQQEVVRDPAAARNEYRALLEKAVQNARVYLDYMEKKYQLGAVSETDLLAPQRRLIEKQRQLAAFDAGALPQPVNIPAKKTNADALRRYRQLLVQEIELATKAYRGKIAEFNLGTTDSDLLLLEEDRVIDLELELAAFDATQGASGSKR